MVAFEQEGRGNCSRVSLTIRYIYAGTRPCGASVFVSLSVSLAARRAYTRANRHTYASTYDHQLPASRLPGVTPIEV